MRDDVDDDERCHMMMLMRNISYDCDNDDENNGELSVTVMKETRFNIFCVVFEIFPTLVPDLGRPYDCSIFPSLDFFHIRNNFIIIIHNNDAE